MTEFVEANELMAKLAQQDNRFSPITPEDQKLYEAFFVNEDQHTYGNSWTYVTQSMFGIGPHNLGYKFYDGENLVTVAAFPKLEDPDTIALYWVRPLGKQILDLIVEKTQQILAETGHPSYIKKLFPEQHDYLISKGMKEVKDFPWHSSAPSEDDTYPEVVLDVEKTLEIASKLGKTRQLHRSEMNYEHFKKNPGLSFKGVHEDREGARKVLASFFETQATKSNANLSVPEDYFNIISQEETDQNVQKLIYIDGEPVGFYFSSIQGDTASLYATITMRRKFNQLVDFAVFDLLNELKARGIKYLNLGGSETESLKDFKQKFRPIQTITMQWVCIY
jgi:hypothetical protein